MHVPYQDHDPSPGPFTWIEAPPPMTLERLARLMAAEGKQEIRRSRRASPKTEHPRSNERKQR